MFVLYAVTCAGVCVGFTLVWAWAKARDNWSLVDAAWALFPAVATLPAALAADSLRGWLWVGGLACWGGRLAWHLHGRVSGGREREDPRYAELRARWGADTPRQMFGFYQIQAVSVWALIVPAHLACADHTAGFSGWEWAGALLALLAVAGESAADRTLRDFRADPANRGKICARGWWAWSRHPNYFFEWLVWCGAAIAATGAPAGLVAWVAPALMAWLLLRVTGVPMSEARALRTKGEAWREYAARTSVFVPLPPRRSKSFSQP